MPVYTYACQSPTCVYMDVEVDVIRGIDRPLQEPCLICGALMRRVFPQTVLAKFKGAGFHVNDYPSASD